MERSERDQSSAWSHQAVRVVSYDPSWPARFEQERQALLNAIGAFVTGGIHHVGSTAVPGLDAKPVIDILVGVRNLATSRACFEPLVALDYRYTPDRDDETYWFCKPHPSRRTHQLRLLPTYSPRFRDQLALRDYLRSHPVTASDYAALKRQLAVRFAHDHEAYSSAKAVFIRGILDRPGNSLLQKPGPPGRGEPEP